MNQQQFVIQNVEFLFGAPSLKAIRSQKLPEIAVIGRSNVGKSSFINRVAARRIARVSGTPGSTRELNFYRFDLLADEAPWSLCLVDMPGFGFAKLSKEARQEISKLSVLFLRERRHLKAVILLNDCRREPGEDELAIQRLCATEGISCLIILTKFDTLRASARQPALEMVARAYNLEPGDLLVTGEGYAPHDIWRRIWSIIL